MKNIFLLNIGQGNKTIMAFGEFLLDAPKYNLDLNLVSNPSDADYIFFMGCPNKTQVEIIQEIWNSSKKDAEFFIIGCKNEDALNLIKHIVPICAELSIAVPSEETFEKFLKNKVIKIV
ncbi:MAG: hypothetical protein ACTSU2_07275 [Promethearchaeota archaeon]